MRSEFVSEVKDSCEAALVRHGFRPIRRHEVALDISRDFLGWIGLNVGNHQSIVRINPFVGVHCIPLMRLVADVSGEKYRLGSVATFAEHLGMICPHVEVFEFSGESERNSESERLAQVMRAYGQPYMEALASYEKLLPAMQERVPMLGGYPQRVAAALYLMDRHEEAREFVLTRQAEYKSEESIVRDSFNQFALPFLKLLAH